MAVFVLSESVGRFRDVCLSTIALTASLPLIFAAAVAVKLDSPGPALYKSRRVGRHGRPFNLLKLRTMRVIQDPSASLVTASSDPRITPVGSWLRHTKIDELPQLWNVIMGDVSLVGPRPEVQRYVDCYPEHFREILAVRPGLTDPAILQFFDEEALLAGQANPEQFYITDVLPKKIELYLEYVRGRSFAGDTRIMAETAKRIVRRVVGRREG